MPGGVEPPKRGRTALDLNALSEEPWAERDAAVADFLTRAQPNLLQLAVAQNAKDELHLATRSLRGVIHDKYTNKGGGE